MREAGDNADELSAEQIIKELRATFREEASELLAELESALLELEERPDDREQIGRAFRAMHTIKGSSGACEFHDIVAFTHELETIFDRVRNGSVQATARFISLILSARDHIKNLLDHYYHGSAADPAAGERVLAALRELAPGADKPAPAPSPAPLPEPDGKRVTYRIRYRPQRHIFRQGTNPLRLIEELSSLGPCTVAVRTEAVPALDALDPGLCFLSWDAILSTGRGVNAIRDVFIFSRDNNELQIDVIDDGEAGDGEEAYKRLGEILLERGDVSSDELYAVLNAKKRVGEMLVETGAVGPEQVEAALLEQQHVREVREERRTADTASSIRVATNRLDSLVDLVGELVTAQARLSRTAASLDNPELQAVAEEVERLTAELRDNAMQIRMLPIGTTFSRFRRLVRDLSAELGKEIELMTEGAETELDKTVIERLGDPLVHLIRNCIDHGIETPAARKAAGKRPCGTIRLSALHSGAHVLIRIEDDGAGLDAAAIRAKAVERGLLRPDREPPERELWELIFAPGFSTARQVTGVSGRGVGMDVVKRAIDALRGSIEVESEKGRGVKITLKLPLTLAIIDGFLTVVGHEHFIFPLSLVEECVELNRGDADRGGRSLAAVRGSLVPYIRLRERFLLDGDAPAQEQIVITNTDGMRVGFVVDAVVGEHQTVLKSLGRFYREAEGVSGATILGDGTVALIVDVPKLVRLVERLETRRAGESR